MMKNSKEKKVEKHKDGTYEGKKMMVKMTRKNRKRKRRRSTRRKRLKK